MNKRVARIESRAFGIAIPILAALALLGTTCSTPPVATPEASVAQPTGTSRASEPRPAATRAAPAFPLALVTPEAPPATLTPVPPTESPADTATPTPGAPTVVAATGEVASEIVDLVLEDLTIAVGSTVTWTNLDGPVHTSSSGIPPDLDGIWDSEIMDSGTTFSFTFDRAGEFPYWCRIHSYMTATVKVVEP